MAMQDGAALDVRPGPDPARAAPEHHGAYHTAALFLALYATALIGWTVYGIIQGDGTARDFVEGLFNPGASPASQLVGPWEWAFTAALLATAGLALAHRRLARSAALLCGFLLLALSVREVVGLFDAAYRDRYGTDPLGGWALATRALGLVVAVTVLVAMFPATERWRSGRRTAPPSGGRPRRLSRICGVLFLVMALARLALTVRDLTTPGMDTAHYLRSVVDGSSLGTLNLAASGEFTTVSSVVVLLVLGVLALRARRDIRGALLVFAAMQLYLTVRTVVWLTVTDFFNQSFETPEGALSMATTAYALAAMTSVVVLAMGRGFGASEAYGEETAAAGGE
ncbi:hypothetical protein [Streptomyces sp. CT34]|uniref:hypothetical protein n=1 Tax=Streptomyces sp. CT34 TaxID=1553907 RepID=UPI0005BDCAED|nr:hypothetical protein [Streptomyces sp. CT34]